MAVRSIWHRSLMSIGWLASSLATALPAEPASPAQAPERMSRARTEEVMRDYLAALLGKGPFAIHMAPDIAMTLTDVNQEISGKDAVEQAIIDFHWVAFDTKVEIRSFMAGSGTACAEMLFVGKHTGDFVGIPATGRDVRVPYVAVWDLEGDRITALRLYGPAAGLVQQLTGDETA